MKQSILIFISFLTIGFLSGCAAENNNPPCPAFGKYCEKTPVNSWNYAR